MAPWSSAGFDHSSQMENEFGRPVYTWVTTTTTVTADSLSPPKLGSKGTSGRREIATQPGFQAPLKQHVIWKRSSLPLTSILKYFQQSCQAPPVTFFSTSGEPGDPPGPADATPQHAPHHQQHHSTSSQRGPENHVARLGSARIPKGCQQFSLLNWAQAREFSSQLALSLLIYSWQATSLNASRSTVELFNVYLEHTNHLASDAALGSSDHRVRSDKIYSLSWKTTDGAGFDQFPSEGGHAGSAWGAHGLK